MAWHQTGAQPLPEPILIRFMMIYGITGIQSIDPSHKSHNASDKYPTMHHFVTEMCTYVHISVTKWCIMGYRTVVNLVNYSVPTMREVSRLFQQSMLGSSPLSRAPSSVSWDYGTVQVVSAPSGLILAHYVIYWPFVRGIHLQYKGLCDPVNTP